MITYPDVSHHQGGLSLAGAALVVAKASQGQHYRDPAYPGFRAQAAQLGIPLAAYHWLDTTEPAGQADNAYGAVGPHTPLMIDDEQGAIVPSHTLAFTGAYRALGGRVHSDYPPHWLWERSGRPDLRPLAAAGLLVVASSYGQGPDSDIGWTPYGGVTPTVLQYTDHQLFNGQYVDFNAYRGTAAQLWALFNGETMTPQDLLNASISGDPANPYSMGGALWTMLGRSDQIYNHQLPALRALLLTQAAAIDALSVTVAQLVAMHTGGPVQPGDLATVLAAVERVATAQEALRGRLAAAYGE